MSSSAKPLRREDRRDRVHRAEAHLRRVERGPRAVGDAADRRQAVALHRVFGRQDEPGRAVGDLRAVAGRDRAERALESGPELAERFHAVVRAHAVVALVMLAARVIDRFDLRHVAGFLRPRSAAVAFERIGVHRLAADLELVGQDFRRLAHVEVDHRIGQPLEQPDDGRQVARPELRHRLQLRARAARHGEVGEPVDHAVVEQDRRVAERFRAAGEDQLGAPVGDVAVGGVDRLQAGRAVALHGPGGHPLAAAEPAARRCAPG